MKLLTIRLTCNLKVPSLQIILNRPRFADGKTICKCCFKRFVNVASIFNLNLTSPNGIATCTALHAICRFRRQYCSRNSNRDKITFFLKFQNFSKVFKHFSNIYRFVIFFLKISKQLNWMTNFYLHLNHQFIFQLKGTGSPDCTACVDMYG